MPQAVVMKFNLDDVVRQLGKTMTPRLQRAGITAVNRTAASEKVAMSRAVATDMRLKVGVVKDAIALERASLNRPTAYVIAKGKRIPVIEFNARGPEPSRGRGKGVTANLPARRYPNAFIARMRSGHRVVFQRSGKARLPIYELKGPSIAAVFQKHLPAGETRRNEQLVKEVTHQIQFALQRGA